MHVFCLPVSVGCREGAILLSKNKTLAPLELVKASSSRQANPPANVYDSVSTWCTTDDDSDPFIDLQFTSPVLVTMMATTGTNRARGINLLGTYYITNFTLEYSSVVNSSLTSFYSSAPGAIGLDNRNVSNN